jgi:uncharacterized protein (TIGR00255 family)
MKSMTGHGRGDCAKNGRKITVELSSVNRKQAEIALNMPRNLEPLESQMRDEINRRISRGRLTARVTVHQAEDKIAGRIKLNAALAKAYAKELKSLAKKLNLPEAVSLDLLVRAPGVFESTEETEEAEELWSPVEKALTKALAVLVKMREREGAHLSEDLQARMAVIREAVERIRLQAPQVQVRYREQLLERIKNAGLDSIQPDDERVIKEVVFFADRSDISEELTRLQSHFKQFEDCVKSKEPVGRTLDFLSQEMNREINTIGSKANDSVISREVVVVKAELERFREQAQNVE